MKHRIYKIFKENAWCWWLGVFTGWNIGKWQWWIFSIVLIGLISWGED